MKCPKCDHVFGTLGTWETSFNMKKFKPLRDNVLFTETWDLWIEWCQRDATSAKVPDDIQAKLMLEEALPDPTTYIRALRKGIEGNWKRPHVELLTEKETAKETVQNARVEDAYGAWTDVAACLSVGSGFGHCSERAKETVRRCQKTAQTESHIYDQLSYLDQKTRFVEMYERVS